MSDGEGPAPLEWGEKKYKFHNIRWIIDGRELRKRKLKWSSTV
jgi:hypothetical protein